MKAMGNRLNSPRRLAIGADMRFDLMTFDARQAAVSTAETFSNFVAPATFSNVPAHAGDSTPV